MQICNVYGERLFLQHFHHVTQYIGQHNIQGQRGGEVVIRDLLVGNNKTLVKLNLHRKPH